VRRVQSPVVGALLPASRQKAANFLSRSQPFSLQHGAQVFDICVFRHRSWADGVHAYAFRAPSAAGDPRQPRDPAFAAA